ncbi:MAG: hypothetical protein PVH61_34240 [Candidatus Aminicenantes bacterium]|jgi:hypothetical protein
MYTTKLTMEERLLAADVAITNALGDSLIMERLSFLGGISKRSPGCRRQIIFATAIAAMTVAAIVVAEMKNEIL